MAITKASLLHGWNSRYGINPRIGGRPVFSRSTAARFLTQEGEVDTAIVNTPRLDWATLNLPNSRTERRQVLMLEMARTNNLVAASDFSNAAWVKTGCDVATGKPDPAGGSSACTLTSTGTGQALQTLSDGVSAARTNSVWIRRRTGTGTVQVRDGANDSWVTRAVTPEWARYEVLHAAAPGRVGGVKMLTIGDAVDVYCFVNEDGAFKTSEIESLAAAATRAADILYWVYLHAPQAMMAYVRFVERGTISTQAAQVVDIGNAAGGDPLFSISRDGTGFYQVTHKPTSAITVQATLATATPAIGDTVELLAILNSTGSVEIIQSINGAAVTSAGPSSAAALQPAWMDTRLWLNSQGSNGVGAAGFADLKLVKYADVVASTAQGRMDELRALELGPNGDLL